MKHGSLMRQKIVLSWIASVSLHSGVLMCFEGQRMTVVLWASRTDSQDTPCFVGHQNSRIPKWRQHDWRSAFGLQGETTSDNELE